MTLLSRLGKGENGSVWWARVNGKRRVVKRIKVESVKVFVGLNGITADRRKPLQGVAMKHVSFISSDRDAECPYAFLFGHKAYDKEGADILVLGNTFFTEKAVGVCLDIHVNPRLPLPVF